MFLDKGYEKTGMEAVAEAAGVGIMTIYRHFENKEALFGAVIDRATPKHTDTREWSEQPPHIGLPIAARIFLRAILEPAELDLYRVVLGEARRFPELGRRYHAVFIEGRNHVLGGYLADQHRLGLLQAPNPLASAALFGAMLKSGPFESVLFHATAGGATEQIDDHIARCCESFLRLHGPPIAPPRRGAEG